MQKLLLNFVPACVCFGPLFIVIGFSPGASKTMHEWQGLLAYSFSLGGALMTGVGLSVIHTEMMSLRKRLDAIDRE